MEKDFKILEIEKALDNEEVHIDDVKNAIVKGIITMNEGRKRYKGLHWDVLPVPPDDKLIIMREDGSWKLKEEQ